MMSVKCDASHLFPLPVRVQSVPAAPCCSPHAVSMHPHFNTWTGSGPSFKPLTSAQCLSVAAEGSKLLLMKQIKSLWNLLKLCINLNHTLRMNVVLLQNKIGL